MENLNVVTHLAPQKSTRQVSFFYFIVVNVTRSFYFPSHCRFSFKLNRANELFLKLREKKSNKMFLFSGRSARAQRTNLTHRSRFTGSEQLRYKNIRRSIKFVETRMQYLSGKP